MACPGGVSRSRDTFGARQTIVSRLLLAVPLKEAAEIRLECHAGREAGDIAGLQAYGRLIGGGGCSRIFEVFIFPSSTEI